MPNLILSHVGNQLFQHYQSLQSQVEKAILSSLNNLCTSVEKQLTIHVWIYFWSLNSISRIYLILHCLDYFSFVFIVLNAV